MDPANRLPRRHTTISGQNQVDGMAEPRERTWKGADDVRKATGLREGGGLGCDHQDTHRDSNTSTIARLSAVPRVPV